MKIKLYAQQGYGTGSGESDRLVAGLESGFIDGVILSPKDYAYERAMEELKIIESRFPQADRLFDPQFYAAILAHDPDSRLGKLATDGYRYFEPRRRVQLESESQVQEDIHSCLDFQRSLPVSSLIVPGIVIRQRFNSIEAVIAKHFIRSGQEIWKKIGDGRPLLATLAVDAEALQDKHALEEFLAEITLLECPPSGFYVLIHQPTSEISPELVDARTLAGWMLLNHSLSLNGFSVVNGYSDILTPFLGAAGGHAGATGWFNTQKVFSLDRFAPPTPGGRRPVMRYLSTRMLNSIRVDELQFLRNRFPEVLNSLNSDRFYDPNNGSMPANQIEEVLQTWNAVQSLNQNCASGSIHDCLEKVKQSKMLYERINLSSGMRLTGRSNGNHLDSIEDGIRLFANLAEINL